LKKIFTLFIICTIVFSCKKDSATFPTQQMTGYLRYFSPISDGPGLFFVNDSNQENLFFHNDYATDSIQYAVYKDSVDKHLRLTYIDQGERGCPHCQASNVSERIVLVISLVKD
jgi:hypothetical protein